MDAISHKKRVDRASFNNKYSPTRRKFYHLVCTLQNFELATPPCDKRENAMIVSFQVILLEPVYPIKNSRLEGREKNIFENFGFKDSDNMF